MGWAMMYSACCLCGRLFGYNPLHVPSLLMRGGKLDPDGTREPVCQACVTRGNALRERQGMLPLRVHPDAYDPVDERELP
jgi:hypothetical protein